MSDEEPSRPLMAPRKVCVRGPTVRRRRCGAALWLLLACAALGAVALVLRHHRQRRRAARSDGCRQLRVHDVWHNTMPMLTTESAFRHLDVNGDGTLDVVFGFGTGLDAYRYPRVACDVYLPAAGGRGCGGGLAALDGRSGHELWRLYVAHELFALSCRLDLDADGVSDCVAGGRMAGLYAVSGRTGGVLWALSGADEAVVERSNMYTAQHMRDVDADGTPDLLVAHGGDPLREPGAPSDRLAGRLLVVSGRSGRLLSWAMVPDGRETYYSPQLMLYPDGTELVLFGTGGETHGGSLWSLPLRELLAGRAHAARAIYTDPSKGIMTPPALVDINDDGVADLVMAAFNSTAFALDGLSFTRLWSRRFAQSESYSTPAVGFFDGDGTPDVMVSYQTGPGFPLYVASQTTVLDGRTGRPLLPRPVRSALGAQASPLAVSMPGMGRDLFLYWLSDCHRGPAADHDDREFALAAGTSVYLRSRADFCRLRFGSRLYTRLYALWSDAGPPGALVYDSDGKRPLEYGGLPNFTAIGARFLEQHSEYRRTRRHVGPHDAGGVQRTISTGTLLPGSGPRSVDLVFATFWFWPTRVRAMSAEERRCLERMRAHEAARFQADSPLYGLDHDAFEQLAVAECGQGDEDNQLAYDPFDRRMGQMTVYRVRLQCVCDRCAGPLPFRHQRWPAYMGAGADCYARTP
ncbi:protein FAM234B isoform X2 [Dermacentor albipictus]|uniref:protein FAM234B isoform X2 n=1 Tax=Dermacentor albipictus TaxID=60249 RepID=UPI0038FCDCCC